MDPILKINNDYSYVVTNDQSLRNLLWEKLRFRKKGYFHTRAYRQGIWDGFVDFFNKKTGRFLTGLLPEIRLVLNHFQIPFTVEDEREFATFLHNSIDANFLDGITLYDYQIDLVNRVIQYKRGIIQAPTSAGKAQPLDALIYTPSGPKKMGEIVVGDEVCTPDGGFASVIAIFPQGPKAIYEITFSNGDTVQCSKDHLWEIDCNINKWKGKVKDTNYVIKNLHNNQGRSKFSIRFSKAVYFQKRKIRIHPYLMGMLLGDGNLTNSTKLSNADYEVLDRVRKLLKKDYHLKHDDSYDYSISKTERGSSYNYYTDMLRYYGIFGKDAYGKFIPKDFKYNSYKVRIELLKGLLDSDGYVDAGGSIEYGTSSEILALDVKELVESLGGYCHLRSKIPTYTYKEEVKNGERAYTVTIFFAKHPKELKLISRKFERLREVKRNIVGRIIDSVKFIGIKHCQCILINHPDHLYLTNNFVPTHNTEILISIMKALAPDTPILFLCNRKTLLSQNYKRMMKWGLEHVGRFYGDYHEPNIITCATVQSAHHLDKLLPKFKVVVADEVHRLSNDTGFATFKKLKGASIRVALSATPFKFGGTDDVQKYALKGYFGPIFRTGVVESGLLTTSFLQGRGTLSASTCTFFKITEPQIPYELYIDAVTDGIANNWNFHKTVTKLAAKQKGRTLILVERIKQGDSLKSLMPNALWVYGKDDEDTRNHVIQQLQEAKNDVVAIATPGIFGEGVNFFVHNMINASGGKAEHDIIQRMGRGLRTADDKVILNYYDFMFTINPYLEDHSNLRIKILRKEGHEVTVKDNF